jgi:hypothetical protein
MILMSAQKLAQPKKVKPPVGAGGLPWRQPANHRRIVNLLNIDHRLIEARNT